MVKQKRVNPETAEYWEGYQSQQTRQVCKYDLEKEKHRNEWARGFACAIAEHNAGKVWWRSNTIRTCAIGIVIGVVVVLYGKFSGNGSADIVMGVGGGMMGSSLFGMVIRKLLNDTPVYWNSGGGGYTPYGN